MFSSLWASLEGRKWWHPRKRDDAAPLRSFIRPGKPEKLRLHIFGIKDLVLHWIHYLCLGQNKTSMYRLGWKYADCKWKRREKKKKKHESVLAVKIPKNRHFHFDFDRSMESVKRAAYEECGFDIIIIYKKKKMTEAEDLTLTGGNTASCSFILRPSSLNHFMPFPLSSFLCCFSHLLIITRVCFIDTHDAPARVFLTRLSQQTAPHSARTKQQASLCSSPPHCSLCFPARKTLAPRLHAKWNERRKKRKKWPQAESCYTRRSSVSSSSPALFHWCHSDHTSPPSGRSRQRINPKYSVFF